MKKPQTIKWTIAGAAIVLAASLWAQNPDNAARTPQWEHLALEQKGTTVTGDRELARKINQIGDQGWELVDVESVGEGDAAKIVFFFKRPKP